MVFSAEERQTNDLKMLLRITGDRLEYELQRADAAEMKASFAEERTGQLTQRLNGFVSSQHQMDLTIARFAEERKRFNMVIENLQADLDRTNERIEDLRERKRRAEKETRDTQEMLRQYEKALMESRLKNVTRQQERYVDGVVHGREEGYQSSKRVERERQKRIYLEGFEAGRAVGFDEGKSLGAYYDAPPSRAAPSSRAEYPDDVGARRKGPKALPTLPLSAFSPPNTGTSESFPLPPSPSHNHPAGVVDTSLAASEALQGWSSDVGRVQSRKIGSVVVALGGDAQLDAIEKIQQANPDVKILSVISSANLEQGVPGKVPNFGDGIRTALAITLTKSTPKLVEGVRWALQNDYVLELEFPGSSWESAEELLTAVYGPAGEDNAPFKPSAKSAIVLSNYLPPPHDLNISLVKLMNHESYNAYQTSTATLSFFPAVYVKYTPPRWEAPTPPTPSKSETNITEDTKEKKEWKRRIKMFLGPVIEAFGFERVMYGSSSSSGVSSGNSADWYELARESLAELGVDQESIDAVFERTAQKVYGA
ncbi:hypothetical protein M422DRAFT_60544 [Sphaerobolus stellatus SS14]|uniref:Uncharacterized protein n=1 Tax=Sphaerobolus stellatus (strain SS14) TaxID=990650 RepID=A0A0C9UCZ8_SPHS4|nr:hypothetical protein M422DRAFT_60544 [Sphaerobolus stellatus SS14]